MKYNFNLGTSDFKKLIENNNFFVDKSLFIKEVINESSDVLLIPRPRRFGKSLNFSMLRYFFDIKEESRELFEGLKISKEQEYMEHMNKYPVVLISMKDASVPNWNLSKKGLKVTMSEIYRDYREELMDVLDESEKKYYGCIVNEEATDEDLAFSLSKLTKYLERKHDKKVIVLIDEYDAVMTEMYGEKEFVECINFFKLFYGSALKGNNSIHKALMTGIMRIAKEGIFSGLNNVKVCGVRQKGYREHFGFREEEIRSLIEECKLNYEEAKEWYNGYNFGGALLYNPWSIVNYIMTKKAESYWKNTSGNDLVRELVRKGGPEIKYNLEKMLNGESLKLELEESINLRNLRAKDIYSLLLQSGYLTYEELGGESKCKLPNREVREFVEELLREIDEIVFEKSLEEQFLEKNWEEVEKLIQNGVSRGISYYDIPKEEDIMEGFYHTLLSGMFTTFTNYYMESNRESGMGRPDIMLINKKKDERVVIELKAGAKNGNVEKELDKAKEQIRKKRYGEEFTGEVTRIGIGFIGKEARLEVVE